MFVVIGNIAYDMRDVVEQRHDGGYRILSHSETPGGRAYLQAICLARLGKRVKIIGGVGDDPYGARIRSSLEFEKVSVDLLLTVENSATDIIRIQQDGLHPTYFAQIGASYVLTPGDLKSSYQSIANATAVLVTLGMKFDTLKQALHTVGKKRTIVILRCAPINEDLDIEQISTLLEYIDLLVVSWREVAALSGVDDPDKHTDVDLLEILTKQYNNFSVNIAVHGRDESTYIIWEKVVYKAAVFPLEIVDVGGMLDAFCSAFASEYHQDNFLSALRYAQAAASYSAHIAGAAASMPTQENIRWVLNKFPSFECVTEIKKKD